MRKAWLAHTCAASRSRAMGQAGSGLTGEEGGQGQGLSAVRRLKQPSLLVVRVSQKKDSRMGWGVVHTCAASRSRATASARSQTPASHIQRRSPKQSWAMPYTGGGGGGGVKG
jgi:hypothetical protein